MLGEDDPAAHLLDDDTDDRRLGGIEPIDPERRTLLSGPADLLEVRQIVEAATGIGTWPAPSAAAGEHHRVTVAVERPAAILGLLIAMENLIERRSPWGRWRTTVDTMAARIEALETVTLETVVVEPGAGR